MTEYGRRTRRPATSREQAGAAARDAADPALRGEVRRALQRRQDPRLPPPLHRRGGGGGRRDAGARRPRTTSSPPTASTATRSRAASRPARSWPRCTARPTAAAAAAAARCTSSTSRGASTAATPSSAAGCRSPSGWRSPTSCTGAPRRHRVLLRRRRRRRGRVPRVAEPGRAVEAARAVPLREQPLRDGHRARAPPGADRHRAQGATRTACRAEAVDGMDVLAVEAAASRAADARPRRAGARSCSRRARTASAHTRCTTPSSTATKDEVEQWKTARSDRDASPRLARAGLLADADLAALESRGRTPRSPRPSPSPKPGRGSRSRIC